jgi:glutamine synthetase
MTSLSERVAADDVRFVLATFVDLAGKPCAKLVPAGAVDRLEADGAGFAGYAAGYMGQGPGDPDLIAMPDPASYLPLPFVRDGLAMVQCDPYVAGEPWPFSPRVILRRVVAGLAARGLSAQVGAEVEYFLVRRAPDGALEPADDRDDSAQPCYDARGVTRMYDHLTAVSTALNGLGWDNYANDHEDGNGQFEQNFTHADPLTTADRVVAFRYMVHVLAERAGMTATFMPKPFSDRTGTGMHLHMSLWEGDVPLFPDAGDPRGLGLSPAAYRFVAGILDHAPGLLALIAPTVNSYKRTRAVTPVSGASWAPTSATYGGNDRTHLIRVPDGDRIEVRGVDGSANPYLAMAALLTAGLDGTERSLDPGDPGAGPGLPLPPTLLHAVEALAADDLLTGLLDVADPKERVAAYYRERKTEEFLSWHSRVTPWELDRYLTAI